MDPPEFHEDNKGGSGLGARIPAALQMAAAKSADDINGGALPPRLEKDSPFLLKNKRQAGGNKHAFAQRGTGLAGSTAHTGKSAEGQGKLVCFCHKQKNAAGGVARNCYFKYGAARLGASCLPPKRFPTRKMPGASIGFLDGGTHWQIAQASGKNQYEL